MTENQEINKGGDLFDGTANTDNNLLVNKGGFFDSTHRTYNLLFVIKMTLMAAIGGFLFGYDTGVIGGAELFFHDEFPAITSGEKEMIVSLAVFGAAIGCVLIGPVSDSYGRKITIIIADLLFTLGAILVFLNNFPSFFILFFNEI